MPSMDHWKKLFESSNSGIRHRAAVGILGHSEELQLDFLIELLCSMSHQGLGAAVQKALLQRRDHDLVQKMIQLLGFEDPFVRETACTVLGHSGDFTATPHLLRMIDDPKMMVRRAACCALSSLNDPSSIARLREQLERHRDDDGNVVVALQSALRTLGEVFENGEPGASPLDPLYDSIQLYEGRAYECLSAKQTWPADDTLSRSAEIFLRPSFHPETLIEVSLTGEQTTIRIATLSESLWFFEQTADDPMKLINHPRRIPPKVLDESCTVAHSDADQFWTNIDGLLEDRLADVPIKGCDGITIRGAHKKGDSKISFKAWCPSPDSPQERFVSLLFKLAMDSAASQIIIDHLRHVRSYL